MSAEAPQLRRQLLVWLLVPLCALLVADALVSYWVALSFAQRAYDRSLIEMAREVASHVRLADGRPAFRMPEAARQVLFSGPDGDIRFEVVAAVTGARIEGESLPPAPPSGASAYNGRDRVYDAEVGGVRMRIAQVGVPIGDGSPGSETLVRVAESYVPRTLMAREILASVMVPQILLVAIAALMVWAGVAKGLVPLDRLQRAIAMRSHRDMSPVAAEEVPGEVRPLVRSINELLQRLDRVLTLQNRFIADAAHQLKTPVAGLKAQMELLVRETDPTRLREATGRLVVGVERLSRLVSQLLALARNEPEAIRTIELVPVDLNALALDVATAWVPEAYRKQIDLGFEGTDAGLVIRGEPGRLRELLDNLIDNAVRYSRGGGHVTVRVVRDGREVVLEVCDDGPTIPVDQRERVFERFHRLLGESSDGSGLGLAIANEIASLHNARIDLREDVDGVGNRFSVRFPPEP